MEVTTNYLNKNSHLSEKGKLRIASILDEAKGIFALQGYDQFSLRNIAKQANVSLAAIQHYFPSKEALLLTLIDQEILTYDHQWQNLLAKVQLDAKEKEMPLILFIDELLKLHSVPKASGFILQFWALAHQNEKVKQKKNQFYLSFLQKIEQTLEQTSLSLTKSERMTRSLLIASIVEGSLIFITGKDVISAEVITLKQAVRSQILHLLK